MLENTGPPPKRKATAQNLNHRTKDMQTSHQDYYEPMEYNQPSNSYMSHMGHNKDSESYMGHNMDSESYMGHNMDSESYMGHNMDSMSHMGHNKDSESYMGHNMDSVSHMGHNMDSMSHMGHNMDSMSHMGYNMDSTSHMGYNMDSASHMGYNMDSPHSDGNQGSRNIDYQKLQKIDFSKLSGYPSTSHVQDRSIPSLMDIHTAAPMGYHNMAEESSMQIEGYNMTPQDMMNPPLPEGPPPDLPQPPPGPPAPPSYPPPPPPPPPPANQSFRRF
jgi:hypothetical protein